MKSSLKIVFVIIASFVGAGFASGKEIYLFFFQYGIKGILGLIISSLVISNVIKKVLDICYTNEINSYAQLCGYIVDNNKRISKIFNDLVNIFLLLSFFIMIAGFASLMQQEFKINKIIGCIIILFINYIVSLKNVKGLIEISNYLVPIFVLFLGIIVLKNSNYLNIFFYINETDCQYIKESLFNNWLVKSIIYASYNCVILIPVVVLLSNRIKEKKCNLIISILIFIIILFLSVSIYSLLLVGNYKVYALEMPIIFIAKKYGQLYGYIYILLIGISIFTTATSSAISFLNNFVRENKKHKKWLIYMSILAIPVSLISFGKLVNFLYAILGIIGLLEICVIYFKSERG